MVFTWDSSFEAAPSNNISRSLLDNYIRDTKRAIRERMEVEHEWGPSSSIDSGQHKPGATSMLARGDAAALAALSNPDYNSLFLLEDGSDLRIQIFSDITDDWEDLSTLDHDLLINRNRSNCHPGLYSKNATHGMSGELDMNGNFLIAPVNAEYWKKCVLGKHIALGHGVTPNDLADELLTVAKLSLSQTSTVYSIPTNTLQNLLLTSSTAVLNFFPQIYIQEAPTLNIRLCSGNSAGDLAILNTSGSTVTARQRVERLA